MFDDANQEEQVASQETPIAQALESSKENAPELNFKALRELKDRAERERDEAVAYARHLELQKQQIPIDNTDIDLAENDLAQGSHLKKMAKRINQLEDQIKTVRTQSVQEINEARLRLQYPDIDSVVTSENIAALRNEDPDLAQAIYNTPDYYSKAILAYKSIKRNTAVHDSAINYKDRIEKNMAKPKSAPSINATNPSNSGLSQAQSFDSPLSEDRKKELFAEMQRLRRNYL